MDLSAFLFPLRRRPPLLSGRLPPLLVHCCHHKTGTLWFRRVLEAVARRHGLAFVVGTRRRPVESPSGRGTTVALDTHSTLRIDRLGDFRGSHMIRDPRDIVVSGYFYHLWTEESWVKGGYQETLRALPRERGLEREMERFCGEPTGLRALVEWNYGDPRFLELRYEQVMADEGLWFPRLFRHYGFPPEEALRLGELAHRFSFERTAGRLPGKIREGAHLRSGAPGQWRRYFTPRLVDRFKALAGEALVRLGYEPDDRWTGGM